MKKLLRLAIVSLLSISLVACGTSSSTEETTDGNVKQEMTINLSSPTTLDSAFAADANTAQIISFINDSLFRKADNADGYEPGHAKTVEISEDLLTYTFTLQDNLMWEDGTPLTANDYVYSIKRAVDPETGSPEASEYFEIKNAEAINNKELGIEELGVSATDDKTLVITLEKPTEYFIQKVCTATYAPVNQTLVETHQDLYGTDMETVMASGPFKLGSWEHDYQITLVKNENYWDADSVKLETVNISMIKDTSALIAQYQTGGLSFLDVGADYVPTFSGEANYTEMPSLGVSFIELGGKKDITNNANIREALALTFDRATYVAMTGGLDTAATGMVPVGVTGKDGGSYRDQAGSVVVDVSTSDDALERANELFEKGLEELGMTKEQFNEEFTIHCVDSDGGKKGAQIIQQMWNSNLGLDITLTPLPVNMLMPILMDNSFYAVVGGGQSAEVDDPSGFLEFVYNEQKLDLPEFTALIEVAKSTSGDERMQAYMDAEKVLMESFYYVPQVFRSQRFVYSDGIENLHVNTTEPRLDLKYVEITK